LHIKSLVCITFKKPITPLYYMEKYMINKYIFFFVLLSITLFVYLVLCGFFLKAQLFLFPILLAYLIFFVFRNIYDKEKDLYDLSRFKY